MGVQGNEEKFLKTMNAQFLPHIPFEDMPALYSGAHALIYLTVYEGFGMPVIEAMGTYFTYI